MSVRYSDLAADIKSKLQTISGIGNIHMYERQAYDTARFLLFFQNSTGKILGWEITRRGISEQRVSSSLRHHQMVLQGYMGLQDSAASGITFQNLADDICDLFREATPPIGATWNYSNCENPDKSPAQVALIDDRTFGAVLCHCAVIHISITELIT